MLRDSPSFFFGDGFGIFFPCMVRYLFYIVSLGHRSEKVALVLGEKVGNWAVVQEIEKLKKLIYLLALSG